MKNLIIVLIFVLTLNGALYSQDMKSMVNGERQKQEILKKSLKVKPTGEEKKQAKRLRKEGWMVAPGEREIEVQLATNNLIKAELMHNDMTQQDVHRYIYGSGRATAGSLSAAKSLARTNALAEIQSKVEVSLASAAKNTVNVVQTDAIEAVTSDKFHEITQTFVDGCLTNTETTVFIYRMLPNNNYEADMTIVYDKIELIEMLRAALADAIETEGTEFFEKIEDSLLQSLDQ